MFLSRISYKQLDVNSEGRALGHYFFDVNLRHAENTAESVAAAFNAWLDGHRHKDRIEYLSRTFLKIVK